jgi:hypothetical protein
MSDIDENDAFEEDLTQQSSNNNKSNSSRTNVTEKRFQDSYQNLFLMMK